MSKVDYVDAIFDGERIRFRLAAEDLRGFEAAIRGSAYQCFTKFAGGFWTLADVEAVLMAAISGASPASALAVRNALRSRPPGLYAVLATKILEAALFGIDAAAARFDETAAEVA